MNYKKFKIIVAIDRKFGIGRKNTNSIPWNDGEDIDFFKKKTSGNNAVIMGRNTAESIKNFPLKNRINIVVSKKIQGDNFHIEATLNDALKKASEMNVDNIWIIGGERIYREALTKFKYLCQEIHYTIIPGEYNCDVFFPQDDGIPKLELDTNVKFNILQVHEQAPEQVYLNLLKEIINQTDVRKDRTQTGTLSLFGSQIKFSMMNGQLPVITTKKMWLRGIIEELLFFISGETNTKILENKGINIWKDNTSLKFLQSRNLNYNEGDMGPGYSFQWRHWGAEYKGCDYNYNGQGIDQLNNLINGIKNDPFSRRHILSSWNVGNLDEMALPPCHCFAQFYVSNCGNFLDCLLYQRSVDMFLGSPFNITSYCLLTYIIGHLTDKLPRNFIYSTGDNHIYTNHIPQVRLQLSRSPYHFPSLTIINNPQSLDDFSFESFKITDYNSHSAIPATLAV